MYQQVMGVGAHQTPDVDMGGHQTPVVDVGVHRTLVVVVGGHRTPVLDVGGHRTPVLDVGVHRTPVRDVGGHRTLTRYRLDQANDEFIREGFENVLKRRFPDIMSGHREESTKKARNAGHVFPENEYDFAAMCKYPPRFVHEDIWHELCMHKKSEIGKRNRKKADSDGVISRHTGGSRGYDEHRIILERTLGRSPTIKELFLATHLTKESKKKFWAGMYDESLEGADFCTELSKKVYEAYTRYMIEKYGEDITQHPVGDADLWERAQGGNRFGIGSLDLSFVVTGTTSSSSGSASYADYQLSREEVRNLQSQVERLNKRFEEASQSHLKCYKTESKRCNNK
ncbi:putative transposase, Ptta/En/Spm, plant [Helianthus annuus]|uniref:Transposase, Ptta/En/Spm, plant n=1 Tax=Helianthus annuus TaxID=4232 RepID=A0A251RUV3_HELAN|nr:putative transposase, Ptta/En/Spm, plant [Helianthus annuus]KAJ0540710.1 putative transposase, Ptta/En/Spm, plant [Helianthus annuus]KAJ0886164.1 putative transposase, Ptta/En/Spm, plant [Helianthus annuus]